MAITAILPSIMPKSVQVDCRLLRPFPHQPAPQPLFRPPPERSSLRQRQHPSPAARRHVRQQLPLPLTATSTRTSTPIASVVLLGATSVGSLRDSNPGGLAEAFTYTASASGTANKLNIYIDNNNAASQVVVGLYSNTASNNPGTLLTSGVINNPVKGAWNAVNVPGANVTSGTKYWIAVLSPTGTGTVRFRDVSSGSAAQVSAQSNLTALPASWSPGINYQNSPMSAYAQQVP